MDKALFGDSIRNLDWCPLRDLLSTTYESAAGIGVEARTGLTSVVTHYS